jgi:hypothetical protein
LREPEEEEEEEEVSEPEEEEVAEVEEEDQEEEVDSKMNGHHSPNLEDLLKKEKFYNLKKSMHTLSQLKNHKSLIDFLQMLTLNSLMKLCVLCQFKNKPKPVKELDLRLSSLSETEEDILVLELKSQKKFKLLSKEDFLMPN